MESLSNYILLSLVATLMLLTSFANAETHYHQFVVQANFNLNDPPQRNTIDVPVGGWAVIRFVADNPGVWLFHCHIDTHLTWGLGMAFKVENGVGELQTMEPPPADLPRC